MTTQAQGIYLVVADITDVPDRFFVLSREEAIAGARELASQVEEEYEEYEDPKRLPEYCVFAVVGDDWSIEVEHKPRYLEDIVKCINRRAGQKLITVDDVAHELRLERLRYGDALLPPRILWTAVANALGLDRKFYPVWDHASEMDEVDLEDARPHLEWWADAVAAVNAAEQLGDDVYSKVEEYLISGDAEGARRVAEAELAKRENE